MCFGRSLKGDTPDVVGSSTYDSYPPARPSQNLNLSTKSHHTIPPAATQSASSDIDNLMSYAPPLGPPPNHRPQDTPQEATPSSQPAYSDPDDTTSYAAPPGPPPNHQSQDAPQPYHDWTAIPDTALLPPPPGFSHLNSPTANASLSDAVRAHQWCDQNPLYPPGIIRPVDLEAMSNGTLFPRRVPEYRGKLTTSSPGHWVGKSTNTSEQDCLLLPTFPIYSAQNHSPLDTEISKTIYFEVHITSLSADPDKNNLAIGFVAPPYPTWRLPGWERSSLGVHGDDGRRYVDDTDGGRDFTDAFREDETVGIGMTFSLPPNPPTYEDADGPIEGPTKLSVDVFFTRQGRKTGGWELYEETDERGGYRLEGLGGGRDLFPAIGIYGKVGFEVLFKEEDWLWRGKV